MENFTEELYKRELVRKLNNFISKLPIVDLTAKVAGNYIYYSSEICKLNSKLEIDYSLNEKTNIRRLKEILIDFFPVLYEFVAKEKSVDEIFKDEITEENILSKHIEKKLKYRVERRLDPYNEIICRNLDTDELEMYKMKCPLVFFLADMFRDIDAASITFKEKGEFIKVLEQRNN